MQQPAASCRHPKSGLSKLALGFVEQVQHPVRDREEGGVELQPAVRLAYQALFFAHRSINVLTF